MSSLTTYLVVLARLRRLFTWLVLAATVAICVWPRSTPSQTQTEAVAGPAPAYFWQNRARIQGHLASTYSPDGAFSPDSSTIAVAGKSRVVLVDLSDGRVRKVLQPQIDGVRNLEIQSASFVSPDSLFLLAAGLAHQKGRRGEFTTPELAFQWNIPRDALSGKVDAIGLGGGYLPVRYFPHLHYLGLYKNGTFDLWSPISGRAGAITISQLTHAPLLFTFSPDGHWLLLAQIEMSSTPNPLVVLLREHKFVTDLPGHRGPVLGMAFSDDSQYVVTACADDDVRVFAVQGWKPVETLSGNRGPAHWAEFAPDVTSVASAGEDKTVHVWSVKTGKPVQTLEESHEPLLTLGFSPNGEYIAATSENNVYVWARTPAL
jgi:WD40 repeat protein